jgi:hypothetical protein
MVKLAGLIALLGCSFGASLTWADSTNTLQFENAEPRGISHSFISRDDDRTLDIVEQGQNGADFGLIWPVTFGSSSQAKSFRDALSASEDVRVVITDRWWGFGGMGLSKIYRSNQELSLEAFLESARK